MEDLKTDFLQFSNLRGRHGVVPKISSRTIKTSSDYIIPESLQQIFIRFTEVVNTLKRRHDGRSKLEINDECDVQDLLYSLLVSRFEDVRPEEPTPSFASKFAKIDFILKELNIGIEVKMMTEGLTQKTMSDQILADMPRYKKHYNCKILVFFIYDPNKNIITQKA